MNRPQYVSVLESTLRMYGAEDYLPVFKKYNIDVKTFALLTQEDLMEIGVHDTDLQTKIIKQCKNLRKKEKSEVKFDEEFLKNLLTNMEGHLNLIHAALSTLYHRTKQLEKVQVSDIKLKNSFTCFGHILKLYGKELTLFNEEIVHKIKADNKSANNKGMGKWKYVLAIMVTSTATFFTIKKYLYS